MKIENNIEYSKKYTLTILTENKLKDIFNKNKEEKNLIISFNQGVLGIEITDNKNNNKINTFEKQLNDLDTVFSEIIFSINEYGELENLINYYEIQEKWKQKRKNISKLEEQLSDLVFELNGIISNKNACQELLKQFCIFPFFNIGFYNKKLPLTKEINLYNIFLNEDISLKCNIKGNSIENNKKIIVIESNFSPTFDKDNLLKTIYKVIKNKENNRVGNLNLKCNWNFIFTDNNILEKMEFILELEIRKSFYYKIDIKILGEEFS